jgi:uncharacterized membrane protein
MSMSEDGTKARRIPTPASPGTPGLEKAPEVAARRWVAAMGWILVLVLAAGGIYLVLDRAVAILGTLRGGIPPPPESFEAPFVHRPVLAFLHLVPALLFVVLGPLQFARPVRVRFPALHRGAGRVYLVASAFVAYSSVHLVLNRSFGGPAEAAATILFSTLFACCLGIAFSHIRHRRVRRHREWMIRGFAIGLAVVTIRPVVGMYLVFSDYSVQEILGTAFWISFTIHLIAAEIWINLTRPGKPRLPKRGTRFPLSRSARA